MFIYRMLRRSVLYLIVVLLLGVGGLSAQELRLGVDFVTLFDNTEYSGLKQPWSETLFSARLTPKTSLNWGERNELVVAVDLNKDFGDNANMFSSKDIQFYYGYCDEQVRMVAGIFPREEMRGLRSDIFFDRYHRFHHNRLSGVLARKESASGASFVEFAMDYNGKRTFDTREAFELMTAGRYAERAVYVGYDIMMGHYAKDYNPDTADDVVDNFILTPYLGVCLKAGDMDVDFGVKYVQSVQRDRSKENTFECPKGIEGYVAMKYKGFTVENRTYLGGSLYTYYDRYGKDLYHGLQHYASTHNDHPYNALTLSYREAFSKNTVFFDFGFTLESDSRGMGTRQWLGVSVMLDNLGK
ncbi:MAG: hypothetical protein IKW47_05310 [Alistipes sp.]|nr:hypothetical protein [Alistipes sp.]